MMQCSVLETTHLVGKKWAVPLLYELRLGKFQGFYKFTAKTKITPRTLSRELTELAKAGLIEKDVNERYFLTEKGEELCRLVDDIKRWNIKWNSTHENCMNRSCIECGYFISNEPIVERAKTKISK